MAGIYRLKASGTIAAADIAVTLADGSADIDLSSATIPRNYQGYLLKVYDSSERMIQGYVYTDGAGTVQNIVSAKGGSTRNWASQAAGFDDTTDCRYELWKVNNAVQVSTGSVPANEGKMDTTTANAFAAPESSGVPIDLSSFQDGRHLFWAQDSNNKVACAWISSSAPGGVAETELITTADDRTFDSDTGHYTLGTGWSIGGGVASRTAGAGSGLSLSISATMGGLYHATGTVVKTGTGTGLASFSGWGMMDPAGGGSYNAHQTAPANDTIYYPWYVISGTASWTVDDVSLKRVTDCAATGALLLSTQGGSRGYLFKDAAFNPDLALTYRIYYIGSD